MDAAQPDWYHWAQEQGMYITQAELAALMRGSSAEALLVIDVRDDDNGGGSIRGAVHCPDGSFCAADAVQLARRKDVVVFHCMESARRGPRCARRLQEYYQLQQTQTQQEQQQMQPASLQLPMPRICVLQGGADLWIRRFYKDSTLVEGFDPDYWGFGDSQDDGDGPQAATTAGHIHYARPADQPATPWSAAGSAAASAIAPAVAEAPTPRCPDRVVKTVVLYRHGQGEHNLKDPSTGKSHLERFDPPLTPQGESEARKINAAMRANPPDVAFVSPLWRTLQTAGFALDGVSCLRYALENVREGNNRTKCNHRRPLAEEHEHAFPWLDISLLLGELVGPVAGEEFRPDLKDEIQVTRARAQQVLNFLARRTEQRIAIFSHQGFIRNLAAIVVGLGRHHSLCAPRTGSAVTVCLMEGAGAEKWWELEASTEIVVHPIRCRS